MSLIRGSAQTRVKLDCHSLYEGMKNVQIFVPSLTKLKILK